MGHVQARRGALGKEVCVLPSKCCTRTGAVPAQVFCISISKVRRMQRPVTCSTRQASERVELLLAQQKLLEDCGMQVRGSQGTAPPAEQQNILCTNQRQTI